MPKKIQQMTIGEFDRLFPNEDACCAYLVGNRWPKGVQCPRCGSERVYDLKTMKWRWECPDCREGGAYRFSHIVGTIFENTNKPLKDWFRVIHMMLTSKNGVSALQIHRVMGFGSYRTAWYMCHRVRVALHDKNFRQLMGIVEVDETFIGGKGINKHGKRGHKGGGYSGKTPIVGAVSRKGKVVARVIDRVTKEALDKFVRETVSTKVSLLATDESRCYSDLAPDYPHGTCEHTKGKYVVGAVHTNTIEGFWSIFKRGIVGSYHKVSSKYLPLYVAEFAFRYNHRDDADIFGAAIRGASG